MSPDQLVSYRELEHNGKDAITTQNLFKLEAGLQLKKRDSGSNTHLSHLHMSVPSSKDYTASETPSTKHRLDYNLNSDFIK